MNSPGLNLLSALIALYLLWNLVCGLRGRKMDVEIPGAVPASHRVLWLGMIGALLILAIETIGEHALGIAAEQTRLPSYAIFGILAAGVIEEVVFRGFVVWRREGKVRFWATAIGGSTIFTLLHPYLWNFEGGFPFLSPEFKAWFSGFFIFINSLWFYALRFKFGNRANSILPCILAHCASNLGVYVIKAFQGFVVF